MYLKTHLGPPGRLAHIIVTVMFLFGIWKYYSDTASLWGGGFIYLCVAGCLSGLPLLPRYPKSFFTLAYLCLALGFMNRNASHPNVSDGLLRFPTNYVGAFLGVSYILCLFLLVVPLIFYKRAASPVPSELAAMREQSLLAIFVSSFLSVSVIVFISLFLYMAPSAAIYARSFPFALTVAALWSGFITISLRLTIKGKKRSSHSFRIYLLFVILLAALFEYSTRANWILFGLSSCAFVSTYFVFELVAANVTHQAGSDPRQLSRAEVTLDRSESVVKAEGS